MPVGKITVETISVLEAHKGAINEVMKNTPYLFLLQPKEGATDLTVCCTSYAGGDIEKVKKFIKALAEKEGCENYAAVYDRINVAGKGCFSSFEHNKEQYEAVCMNLEMFNKRVLYHEKGHAMQSEELKEKYQIIMGKDSTVPFLDVHNIIVHENADAVLEHEPPEELKDDYIRIEKPSAGKPLYVRTKYKQKPKYKKINYKNVEDDLKDIIEKLGDEPVEKKWFVDIQGHIGTIYQTVKLINAGTADTVKEGLLHLCCEMIEQGANIFKEPKTESSFH